MGAEQIDATILAKFRRPGLKALLKVAEAIWVAGVKHHVASGFPARPQ